MINHYIILADGWSVSSRIALHYTFDGKIDGDAFRSDVKHIQNCYKRDLATITVHTCQSKSKNWESVVEKDPFFKNILVLNDVDEFIKILKKNENPRSDVISQYILNISKCDLQRLSYLLHICNMEYTLDCGYNLFEDGMDIIDGLPTFKLLDNALETGYLTKDNNGIIQPKACKSSSEARIITSSDGVNRRSIIRKVVETCNETTTKELEKMIRSEDPKSMMSSEGFLIPELVKERHKTILA